jgi:Domain of unknown function (DUF4326)
MGENSKPIRIQRQRTKGWKMPPNTVNVGRPSKYGNPFWIINEEGSPWITDARDKSMPVCNFDAAELLGIPEGQGLCWSEARKGVVALFRQQCCDRGFSELRGKNIACWCPLDQPCHGDVILELANTPQVSA